jgi:hypothetical protein
MNQGLLPMTTKWRSNLFAVYWIAMKAKGNDQSQAFGTK